jgi:hypothetical protein
MSYHIGESSLIVVFLEKRRVVDRSDMSLNSDQHDKHIDSANFL